MKKVVKKRWRVNFVITYASNTVADRERTRILSFLKTLAQLQEVELATSVLNQIEPVEAPLQKGLYANAVSDLLYFRSLPNTAVAPKDFRALISKIFHNHQWITYSDDFEVYQQALKVLPQYPFPLLDS